MSAPSDEASDLRIAIARVLERWQLQRVGIEPSAAEERTNLETLGERLRALESCGEERWEELAMIQTALIAALKRRLQRVDPIDLLSQHIDELKRAVTPQGDDEKRDSQTCNECGMTLATLAEPGEPQRLVCIRCDEPFDNEKQGPAAASCDRCGATLGMIDDGDGSPARLVCPQCQPDELPRFPVVESGGGGRALRVRALTTDEQRAMGEYLAFVQSEPLPASDAATRQRLFEARLKWPQVAALFEGGGSAPTCTLCSYPQDRCRCIENGWR